jgi:hypothetical protein
MRKNGRADDQQASPVKLAMHESTVTNGLESTPEPPLSLRIMAKITVQNAEKMPKF